jgi:hypothetical protein
MVIRKWLCFTGLQIKTPRPRHTDDAREGFSNDLDPGSSKSASCQGLLRTRK